MSSVASHLDTASPRPRASLVDAHGRGPRAKKSTRTPWEVEKD